MEQNHLHSPTSQAIYQWMSTFSCVGLLTMMNEEGCWPPMPVTELWHIHLLRLFFPWFSLPQRPAVQYYFTHAYHALWTILIFEYSILFQVPQMICYVYIWYVSYYSTRPLVSSALLSSASSYGLQLHHYVTCCNTTDLFSTVLVLDKLTDINSKQKH